MSYQSSRASSGQTSSSGAAVCYRQGSDERLAGLPLQLGPNLLRLRRRPPHIADAQKLPDASFQALHQWPPLHPAKAMS